MNVIQVMTDDDPSEQDVDYLKQIVAYVLEKEQRNHVACTVVCLSSQKISEYNKMFRNKDYIPDVLSFPAHSMEGDTWAPSHTESQGEEDYLGDVLICIEQITLQAKKHVVSIKEELTRVVIHGILHLLGHTHKSYSVEEPMLKKQEQLLTHFIDNPRGLYSC